MLAYNTYEKVYVEHHYTGQCIARMCKTSFEVFGLLDEPIKYFHNFKKEPTWKDWLEFKEKVNEYYNVDMPDWLFKGTSMYSKKRK